MPLYLPSQLSPNFEEVRVNEPIVFSFQVNTNGSQVRAYKLEILNDKNDAEDPDDNILATIYGVFDTPLYNKDIGEIVILPNELQEQYNLKLQEKKDYRWKIRLYEDEIDIFEVQSNIEYQYGETYVGTGNLVGTTKQIIWLSQYDNTIKEDMYVQTYCRNYYSDNNFKPFKVSEGETKIESVAVCKIIVNVGAGAIAEQHTYTSKFAIDPSQILPKYKEKIDDGNMYFYLRTQNWESRTMQDWYPKKITGLSYEDGMTWINIDENQAYYDYVYNEGDYYSLWYIQRQQIYSVDKSIGQKQLTKITLDEPLEYNIRHNMEIETNLYSDDFDYNRVYIKPVEEFDNKTSGAGISYINIAYRNEDLIQTHINDDELKTDYSKSDLESYPNCKKITNYVGTTGEVTLFSNLDFMPDRFYMYQIFDIVDGTVTATNEGTYQCIAGVQFDGNSIVGNYRYFLGGGVLHKNASPCAGNIESDPIGSDSKLKIYSNHYYDNNETTLEHYYSVFIQPNTGIFEDVYKPCQLELYNNTLQQFASITNSKSLSAYDKNLSIDTLDDSQWLVTLSTPIQDIENLDNSKIDNNLLWPQTKYKIYTNFVNSVPEGYFYVRSDKTLSFDYYNIYDNGQYVLSDNNKINDIYAIAAKDVLIKCNIHDEATVYKNFVPLKLYKYIVYGNDKIIYESDYLYDGKFECVVRGLETCLNADGELKVNPIVYTVQIIVEDEYGMEYVYEQSIYSNYSNNTESGSVSTNINYNNQCIEINFAPIKTFYGEEDNGGVNFSALNDETDSTINIPEDFLMYFKMKINSTIFNKNGDIHKIFELKTDENVVYKINLDTRPYFYNNSQFVINNDYLSLICYVDDQIVNKYPLTNQFPLSEGYNWVLPLQFNYFIDDNQQSENKSTIYLITDQDNIVNDTGNYYSSVIEAAIDVDGDEDKDNYSIDKTKYIFSNDENIFNRENAKIITDFLYFKIDSSATKIFDISTQNFSQN